MRVGDTVKIVKIVREEPGWQNHWAPEMDGWIGATGKVIGVGMSGVAIENCEYRFPPSSLGVLNRNVKEEVEAYQEKSTRILIEELDSLKKDSLLLELLRENGLEDWPFYQESLKSLG